MNYLQWNDLLIDYYFGDEDGHDVFLGIDKESLVDYVMERGVMNEEIALAQENSPTPVVPENYIWNNFTKLFRGRDFNKEHFLRLFQKHIADSDNPMETPTVFPCIALMIMPLANHPEMDARNFYDRVTQFLRSNAIIKGNESIDTPDLRGFNSPSLLTMWENLEAWAICNGYSYSFKNSALNYRYVGPFMAEALLTASQRDKLKFVFYEAGLTPDLDLTDDQISRILNTHHRLIGFNDEATWRRLFGQSPDIFIGAFRRKYQKWDGNTIIRVHENNRRIGRDSGANKKLYLCFQEFRGTFHFFLKARFVDSENGSEYEFRSNGSLPEYCFHVSTDGYAEESYCPANLESIIASDGQILLKEAGNDRNRLAYVNQDFFLLENFYGAYTSACKLKLGGKFFFLVKREKRKEYSEWLAQNNAVSRPFLGPVAAKYELFWIESAQASFPAHNSLNCVEKPSAHLVNTFVFPKQEQVSYVYSGLPAYFEIEGVNIETDSIRAVFDSQLSNRSCPLSYDEDSRLWKLPVVSNTILRSSPFRLFCNDEKLSTTVYQLRDFEELPTEEYQEIGYDSWGNYSEENPSVKGLTILSKVLPPLEGLGKNMKQFGKAPKIDSSDYAQNDYILYWLSSNPRTDKSGFADAVKVMIQNSLSDKNAAGKWQINAVLDNYCRLGYINYAYHDGKHIIAPNKPTLILLPSKTSTKPFGNGRIHYCTDRDFCAFLSGARTPEFVQKLLRRAQAFVGTNDDRIRVQVDKSADPIYPQRILLWASSWHTFATFAEKFGLQFQRTIYSKSLLDLLGSVEDYKRHILDIDSFNETYEGYSDLTCIDYGKMAALVAEDKPIKNNQVSSSTYSQDGAVVTYFPEKYYEKTILWHEGKQYPIDKYWGHFVGMGLAGAKVARIDEISPGHPVLKLPLQIKLPILYARALTLMTGDIPEYWKGRRVYKLCDNPFTQSMSPESILMKLNQQ